MKLLIEDRKEYNIVKWEKICCETMEIRMREKNYMDKLIKLNQCPYCYEVIDKIKF